MNKLRLTLLCILFLLIGWHLGWQGRGSIDNKELEAEVVRQLDYFLTKGISSGLITINDEMLFPTEETNEPPVPAMVIKDAMGSAATEAKTAFP
jgi:hypothetical protein